MKIYLSHSTKINYVDELYKPVKAHFSDELFYLPQEKKQNSKEIIRDCDAVFAEISDKGSFGSGIELGWADAFNKPIVCFYKVGTEFPQSVKFLTRYIYLYNSIDELLLKMDEIVNKLK